MFNPAIIESLISFPMKLIIFVAINLGSETMLRNQGIVESE